MQPCGGRNRASNMCHVHIARRIEVSVAMSRFGRCSPKEWLMMTSTRRPGKARKPVTCGSLFSLPRSFAAHHPGKCHRVGAQCPACIDSISIRTLTCAGSRRLPPPLSFALAPSGKTLVCLNAGFQSRVPDSTVGVWTAEWSRSGH